MKTTLTKHKNISVGKIDLGISLRILLFTLILMCIAVYSSFATKYFSRASGNWGTNTTWALTYCGAMTSAPGTPGASDTVYICNGYTVTANVAAACAMLDVAGTLTLTTYNYTVSGATSISGTMNDNSATGTNSFGDITISATGTFNNTGNSAYSISGNFVNNNSFNPGTGAFTFSGTSKTFSGSNAISLSSSTISGTYTSSVSLTVTTATISGTLTNNSTLTMSTLTLSGTVTNNNTMTVGTSTISGNINNNGTLTVNSSLTGAGSLTQGTNATLNIIGTNTLSTLNLNTNPNTVAYNYTSGAQTVKAATYYNLVIDKSAQTATLGGATTVSNNLTITSGILSISSMNISVSGTTTVNGTIIMPNNIGVNYFTGAVNVGSSGTWTSTAITNSANLIFKGGIANSGTFNAGAAIFNTNNQSISGTGAISFANNVDISGAITLTNTNSGGLTISGNLNGSVTGSTFDNDGTFTYGGANTPMTNGTLTTSTNPNTFAYVSTTAAQTVSSGIYHHLIINKSGLTATLNGDISVNGNLTITSGILADAGYKMTGNATGTCTVSSGGTLTLGSAIVATSFPTNFIPANISLAAASTVNYNSNAAQTILGAITYGNLTLTAGSSVTKTASDNITVNGTLTVGSNNTFATSGYTMITANAAINGTCNNTGIFTISNALSGSGTFTQGTNATLNIGGNNTITTFTATANPNAVLYNGASGDQAVLATTYHDLTINNSGHVATLSGNATVNGDLNIASGTFQFGTAAAYTLTTAGNVTVNSGATLRSQQTSVGKQHTLYITGNFTNNGNVDLMMDKDDFVALNFQGAGNSTISGNGTWTDLAYMTMNKTNKTDVVHVNSTGFGSALTAGAAILTKPNATVYKNPPVIFTKGNFRYNIPDALSNLINSNASASPWFTINSNVVFQIDQGTVDMAYYPGIGNKADLVLSGSLVINGGTVTVSKSSNDGTVNGLWYSGTSPSTPTFTMTGGTIQVYGAFTSENAGADDMAFSMSAGSIYVNMLTGNHITRSEPFWITDHTGSMVNWTGGTLYIQEQSRYDNCPGHPVDFDIGGAVMTSWTVSGNATVVFGTPGEVRNGNVMKFMAYPNVVYPHFIVGNPGSLKSNTVEPYNNANWKLRSLTIQTNQTFDMWDYLTATTNHTMTITSDNGSYSFYNDGAFTARNSTVTFAGSSTQNLGGTTANFYNLNFQNSAKTLLNVNASNGLTLNNTVNLNTKTMTLGTSAASTGTLTYTGGMLLKGTFTRWFATTAVANGDVKGLFPMGDTISNYRPFYVSYPAGVSTGGSVSLNHTTIYGSIPVTIVDGAYTILARHNSYWTSAYSGFAGVSGIPFNLQAGATGMGSVTNITDLRVMRSNDVIGTAGTNSGTNTNPIVARTGLTLAQLGNSFYIGTTNSTTSPLPIELVSFDAKVEDQMVKLTWATASEFNNDFFTVERSKNAMDFEEVLKINGAGNSNELLYYSAIDKDPYKGVSYYRLKQTDFNGTARYSDLVQVVITDEVNFTVFPNPSDGTTLYIQFAEQVKDQDIMIKIYDINGRLVYKSQKTVYADLRDNTLEVNLNAKLSKGIYVINITTGNMKKTCQFVVK